MCGDKNSSKLGMNSYILNGKYLSAVGWCVHVMDSISNKKYPEKRDVYDKKVYILCVDNGAIVFYWN